MTSHPKMATPDHEIHDLIRRRWSPRAFDAAREVPRTELLRLLEAARWAPSSGNEQPWMFLVTDRAGTPEAYRALLHGLNQRNQAWAASAPVLVLVALRESLERNETITPGSWYDAGQAVAFLTLQATSQNISIRQIAGFDRERVRVDCAVPAGLEPAVVIAIGYAGDPDTLVVDRHREAERQPRLRRPVEEFAFDGAWGRKLG